MNESIIFIYGNVTEVAIFYSPQFKNWIIRQYNGGLMLGDNRVGENPTYDFLRAMFGAHVLIRRDYMILSKILENMVIKH